MASYTKSTNFTAKDSLPTGDSARIVKGTEIDTEFTAISNAIASKADSNSPTFTGTPAAPTAVAGTNTTQLATTAFATAAALAAFPAGGIIMWSGSIASIPSGWALCNGSSGTPDLRDKFVIGAGTLYAVNATGGSKDATLVSHTHTATNTLDNAAHRHFTVVNAEQGNEGSLNNSNTIVRRGTFGGDYSYDFASNASEGNIGLTSTAGGSLTVTTAVSTEGSSATNANLPPYLALAYIMKL